MYKSGFEGSNAANLSTNATVISNNYEANRSPYMPNKTLSYLSRGKISQDNKPY